MSPIQGRKLKYMASEFEGTAHEATVYAMTRLLYYMNESMLTWCPLLQCHIHRPYLISHTVLLHSKAFILICRYINETKIYLGYSLVHQS